MHRFVHRIAFLCLFAAVSAAQAGEVYRLRPGDKIEVWTAQDPLLNRQVTVAPDGRIAMPMAGHLLAAGLSPEELEQQLAARLRAYFKDPVELNVILTSTTSEEKAATIYVIGSVEHPGVFPYRSNMVVLHAVGAAGGFFRPSKTLRDEPGGDGQVDLAATTRKLRQALLKAARLNSELNGQETVAAPAELGTFAKDELAGAVEQERSVLTSRRAAFQAQLRVRERVAAGLKEEVAALQDQVVGSQRSLEAQQKDLDAVRALAQRGLVVGTRETDAARLTSLALSLRQDTQVRLIKAQNALAEAVAATASLQDQRRLELLSETQLVGQEIRDLRARRSALTDRVGDASGNVIKGYDYEILRTVDGALRRMPVDDLQPIEPGDLIRVIPRREADGAPGQAPGQPSAALRGASRS